MKSSSTALFGMPRKASKVETLMMPSSKIPWGSSRSIPKTKAIKEDFMAGPKTRSFVQLMSLQFTEPEARLPMQIRTTGGVPPDGCADVTEWCKRLLFVTEESGGKCAPVSEGPMEIAERALEFVQDGNIVGLGSGRAATAFVRALGRRVQAGLRVRSVPTSQATAQLATATGIPLVPLTEDLIIDVTVDGADEVDPQLDLIKGYGGALVREKIVAAASRRLVILVGSEKLVSVLGQRGLLPIEVVPFGASFCRRRLQQLGYEAALRGASGGLYVTDNGNHILDCRVSAITHAAELEQRVLSIPGVVGTGLFVGMADTVLVQAGDQVEVRTRTR